MKNESYMVRERRGNKKISVGIGLQHFFPMSHGMHVRQNLELPLPLCHGFNVTIIKKYKNTKLDF